MIARFPQTALGDRIGRGQAAKSAECPLRSGLLAPRRGARLDLDTSLSYPARALAGV
jgi:hypothetical protein